MALALTIPGLVDGEPMLSVVTDPDGVSFQVVINAGATATRLLRAAQNGEHLPLVVLTTDAAILALDSVYVASVVTGSPGGEAPTVTSTLVAGQVQVV